jgi:transmembrane sensor
MSAEDVEQQAAHWIDRRDRSDWTTKDQAELDAWLAQSMTHSIAFWRLNAAWKRTERLAALRPGHLWKRKIWSHPRAKPLLLRSAMALAAGAFLAGGTFYLTLPATHTYATPIGGREILSLADGSQIELNTNSELRIVGKADARQVWLERGEAFFQIRHDAAHPFVVNVAGHRITDLGTKFAIRTDQAKTEIVLTEGSARVEVSTGSGKVAPVTLKPGDVAIATAERIAVTKKPERLLDDGLAWRRGLLIFDNTTLADAAAQFNRYTSRRIVVEGEAASLKVDGTFPSNDTAAFTAIVAHILHLKVKNGGGEIVLSRR